MPITPATQEAETGWLEPRSFEASFRNIDLGSKEKRKEKKIYTHYTPFSFKANFIGE